MGGFGAVMRKCFVVEFTCAIRIEAQVELIFPAKLETGFGESAAVKIVSDFIRSAKLGDSALPFSDGAERLETRAALESAVEKLELLREQLYRENMVLRDEVDRISMFE